jgi:hypothetical protein
MGVDGTWRRNCFLLDASASGAKLEIEGSVEVLQSKEFFLVLSSTGLAVRRCEMIWVDGSQIGVKFIENDKGRSPRTQNDQARHQLRWSEYPG